MENISVHDAKKLLDTEQGSVVLDVREPWEHEICHISGSLHIPMAEIPARTGELDTDAKIIVLCHHGMRSQQVAGYLESTGYHHVVNMTGGIDRWAEEIDTDMPRY